MINFHKKSFLRVVVGLIVLANSAFVAAKKSQLEIAKSIVPKGYDLAQTYSEGEKGSFVFYDFNKDGRLDVAMMVEKTICKVKDDCGLDYSDSREFQVYFKSSFLGYRLVARSKNIVMSQGEGGMAAPYSDPFIGLTLNKKGSVVIDYWGGSALKWGFTFVLNFRKYRGRYGLYLVGKSTMYSHFVKDYNDMEFVIRDHNLLTGKFIITKTLISSDESKTQTGRSKGLLKSLSQLTSIELFN